MHLNPRDIDDNLLTPPAEGVTRVFIINRHIEQTISPNIPYVNCIIDLGITYNFRTRKPEYTSQNAVAQCLGLSGLSLLFKAIATSAFL